MSPTETVRLVTKQRTPLIPKDKGRSQRLLAQGAVYTAQLSPAGAASPGVTRRPASGDSVQLDPDPLAAGAWMRMVTDLAYSTFWPHPLTGVAV